MASKQKNKRKNAAKLRAKKKIGRQEEERLESATPGFREAGRGAFLFGAGGVKWFFFVVIPFVLALIGLLAILPRLVV